MNAISSEFDRHCRVHLDRYFSDHPDDALRKRALKAMRLLTAGGEPLSGKSEGWAAGIIYFLVNQDRRACGVPGLLNSEVESYFSVSMGTIRKRAARIEQLLTV